jgi:hypothetical protein
MFLLVTFGTREDGGERQRMPDGLGQVEGRREIPKM